MNAVQLRARMLETKLVQPGPLLDGGETIAITADGLQVLRALAMLASAEQLAFVLANAVAFQRQSRSVEVNYREAGLK